MTHSRSPVALVPVAGLGERLLDRSIRTETGCLEWQGSRDRFGYGWIRNGGRSGSTVKTHRASFAVFIRPLRDGEEVCHSCDNPPCIAPEHLFAGTQALNMADMLAKGRRRPDIGYIKGETHHQAKLAADQVRAIRVERQRGASYRSLAAQYGMSKTTIADICRRKLWRDLPD